MLPVQTFRIWLHYWIWPHLWWSPHTLPHIQHPTPSALNHLFLPFWVVFRGCSYQHLSTVYFPRVSSVLHEASCIVLWPGQGSFLYVPWIWASLQWYLMYRTVSLPSLLSPPSCSYLATAPYPGCHIGETCCVLLLRLDSLSCLHFGPLLMFSWLISLVRHDIPLSVYT